MFYLLESFRFWDEDDYEYEIFSILSIGQVWTSVILAGFFVIEHDYRAFLRGTRQISFTIPNPVR